jgi:hypothetical protein
MVRIIYDAVGSIASDSAFFAGLAARGIEVAEFRFPPVVLYGQQSRPPQADGRRRQSRLHGRPHQRYVLKAPTSALAPSEG